MDIQKFWLRYFFLGYADITRTGVYKSPRGIITTGSMRDDGYLAVSAWDRWAKVHRYGYIHRLVWLRYKGRIPKGKEVNHKDGNPMNNRLDNLELVSHLGNMRHASRLNVIPKGEKSVLSKLTDAQVIQLREDWIKVRGTLNKAEFVRQHLEPDVTYWCLLYALNGKRYKHLPMPAGW